VVVLFHCGDIMLQNQMKARSEVR